MSTAEASLVEQLEAARVAHASALALWNRTNAAQASIENEGRLDGKLLDPVERTIALDDVRGRAAADARALVEAKQRLAEAEREHVAVGVLPKLTEAHRVAADTVERRKAAVETAYIELGVLAVLYVEAVQAEQAAALAARRAVGGIAEVDDGSVPVTLHADGSVETRPRADARLFGCRTPEFVPDSDEFASALGRVARNGRERVAGLIDEHVADLILQRLEQLDATNQLR